MNSIGCYLQSSINQTMCNDWFSNIICVLIGQSIIFVIRVQRVESNFYEFVYHLFLAMHGRDDANVKHLFKISSEINNFFSCFVTPNS